MTIKKFSGLRAAIKYALVATSFILLPAALLFTVWQLPRHESSQPDVPTAQITATLEPEMAKGFTINFADYQTSQLTDKFILSHDSRNGGGFNCVWNRNNIVVDDGKLRLGVKPLDDDRAVWTCAEMLSIVPLHYGTYEFSLKTPGVAGTVVNVGTYSDTGDEIDIEFNGQNPSEVELNYWADGINSKGKIAKLNFDTSADFHTYAFAWKKESITWYADGQEIWSTVYKETGKPVDDPSPILINFWNGTQDLMGWVGYLPIENYDPGNPIVTEIEWVKFRPE
jgi:endoglucanase